LKRQRAAGKPQRAIILKARQVGFSTIAQVVAIIRCSQTENHLALTVAQERKTVAALFAIGERTYLNLPLQIRPPAPRSAVDAGDVLPDVRAAVAAAARGGGDGHQLEL
jgi:hypothetical protein